jgi:nucleotide-binding universal stress UspA family protein
MPTERTRSKHPAVSTPTPFPRILCAVDGSRSATQAIEQALALAGDEAALTFLSVTDSRGFGPARIASLGRHSADDALEHARAAARAAGVEAQLVVRHGDDPRQVILDVARGQDLLVLGTHGRHRAAGFLLGSTTIAALHHSPVPVMVARPLRAGSGFAHDILLATDGSPAMGPIVAVTAALAQRHESQVVLAHVRPADRTARHELAEEVTTLLEVTGDTPVVLELEGHPPSRIVELVPGLHTSLVITGSRGLTGIRALGSVSERIGTLAPCSVLVMRSAS